MSNLSGVPRTSRLTTTDRSVMEPIVRAMIRVETGTTVSAADYNQAWELFLKHKKMKNALIVIAVLVVVFLLGRWTKNFDPVKIVQYDTLPPVVHLDTIRDTVPVRNTCISSGMTLSTIQQTGNLFTFPFRSVVTCLPTIRPIVWR